MSEEREFEITEQERTEQSQIRRDKLAELQAAGRNPFLQETWDQTAYSQDIKDNFEDYDGKEVSIAGRMMAKRVMGKASFIDIQDYKGRIQCHVKRDVLGTDEYKWFMASDIGDIFGIVGNVFMTNRGEITVEVTKMVLLSKSLQVLPDKWSGLKDMDIRYRQRYVDLIVNPEVKESFIKRAAIIKEIKRTMEEDFGYLEVDTPILTTIAGGANARPFNTFHNTLHLPMKLRIANELYLKRLIVGGFSGVYEFAKNFRNEGMDKTHNPEFTCVEMYIAYKDYIWMMEFTEKMLKKVAEATGGVKKVIGGNEISFEAPFRRLPILDAIKEYAGVDVKGMDEAQLRDVCKKLNVEVGPEMGVGKLIDAIFGQYCEEKLIQPTFVIDYPVEMSPLTKRCRYDDTLTERFELFVNGKELANAYSELNDPIDQLERFEEQAALKSKGDDEAMYIDYDFVRALEYGMPPTSGIGIGIDRLTMFMTGQESIQDVLFFPMMRPEKF